MFPTEPCVRDYGASCDANNNAREEAYQRGVDRIVITAGVSDRPRPS